MIENIKRKMLIKYPYFGSVITNVKYIENNEIKTLCTDGEIIYYNNSFLYTLDINQQIFVFTHEVCHIAFNHINRSKNKDSKIWNIATDAIINAFLLADGLKSVKGAIEIENAINYDSEELYNKLLKNNKKNTNKPHASHKIWNKQKENNKFEKIGEIKTYNENKKIREKLFEDLKGDIIKESIKNTKEELRYIDEIDEIETLLNWKYILKKNMTNNIDWSYKNGTIENGVITPNLEKYINSTTEILIDTSNSINNTLLKFFLTECYSIIKYSELQIGCFDTKFYGFHKIRTINDIRTLTLIGGGGTDFDIAIKSFSKNATNKILFTDGLGIIPKNSNNITWIIYGNKKIDINKGKVIYIDEKYKIYKNSKRI